MKASILYEFSKPPKIETIDDPTCPSDGVIVEIRACGVCRTDHHGWSGHHPAVQLPHVMGHELAGYIVETGHDVNTFRVGDRVTVPFILGCGSCPDCMSGQATICDSQSVIGFTRQGAFAEYIAIPKADFNLVHLPEMISFTAAAALGCRMTTAYRGLIDRGMLGAGETAVIHGCGGVGISAIMIAKAIGARVIAVDVNEKALALSKQVGADDVINAGQIEDVGAYIRDMTKGGAHVSMDALGITTTFENSIRCLKKLGRHIQIGMPVDHHKIVDLPLYDLIYTRQLQISGSRGLSADGFPPLIDLIASGKIDATALVSAEIRLSDVPEALANMNNYAGAGVNIITDFNN
jgi:alcohol dehydrogenase